MMVADLVYILCALTSLVCAVLLWRGYRGSGARLLFWASLCFTGLFLNNLLLVVETTVIPTIDLIIIRQVPALAGIALLLYGLIWEAHRR